MDMQTYTRLAFWEREEISRGLARSISLKEIAMILGREPSTIGREIDMSGGKESYRAETADNSAGDQARFYFSIF